MTWPSIEPVEFASEKEAFRLYGMQGADVYWSNDVLEPRLQVWRTDMAEAVSELIPSRSASAAVFELISQVDERIPSREEV